LALVNFMQRVADWFVNWWTQLVDWVENWWTHLQPGDRGTWFGGLATFLTLAATLIITAASWMRQRSREAKLREADRDAARRSHAEKLSCWVAGRINSPAGALPVHPGDLVVTLINASEQPFTEAVVEVRLREDQSPVSTWAFTISVVPPGTSWFAFDSNGEHSETLLLPIWFLDNGVGPWTRSSVGALEETTKEQLLAKGQGAAHVWLRHGDPGDVLGLDDPKAQLPGSTFHAGWSAKQVSAAPA
jgi:hypothetical protein